MASIRTSIHLAAALAVFAVLSAAPAGAACFESGVGCTNSELMPYWALRQLSCDALWTVRNTIYYENGYCFHTARGQAVFANSGCRYNNASLVPLNSYERSNIDRVVRVEKEKHC